LQVTINSFYKDIVIANSKCHLSGMSFNLPDAATGVWFKSNFVAEYKIRLFMDTTTIINVKNLRKEYVNGKNNISVIQGLDLKVSKGDFAMIMGNSGTGKSTLLYMLGGLDKSSHGEVWLYNELLSGKNEKELTIMRRKNIGFVFQEHHLVSNLNLLENVLLAGYLEQSDRQLVRQRAQILMDELEISHLTHRYPAQVSGGEAQRCSMVRALINNPAILLADEPTGNLNSSSSEKVLQCLKKLNKDGQTIVMVTHNLNAACYGNIVHFMMDGKLRDSFKFKEDDDVSTREPALFEWLRERGW
jgi:putative ABC transport system ATP-binding protein